LASLELQKAISNWENKQKEYGFVVDENYIDTYCLIANTALSVEKDAETGLRVSAKVKKTIENFCIDTFGKTIWELERQKQYNGWDNIGIIDRYYDVLKAESYYLFESFIYYMERNRGYSKRFYQPRRKTLKCVVDDLQALEDKNENRVFYGLSMPSRVGKAIAYNTPVLTQNGWKKHGELTLYDRVIGLDGEFKRITAIHNPCQMEYKVTFSDGEEIICHGNHEWRLHDRNHGEKIRDVETKEIFLNYKNKDGRNRFILPNRECVSGSHSAVWVDPYTLGAWLGDGRNRNPDICGDEKDFAIVQKILDAGYKLSWETKHKTTGVKYYGFKGLREQLQKYGMCHSRKTTFKRIPSEYLVADEEQRLELLAGLLDTDGYLNQKEHRYQFTTNEEFLKNDFVSLVSTFGWRVSVTKRNKSVSSSGICANKPYWVISFNPTRYIPCQLERKKLKEYSQQKRLTIEKVEKIDNYIIGNCITVEDEIYCVGRTLKPTHNSTVCIFFLAWIALKRPNSHSAMGGHSGILAKGFYKELLNLITTPEYTFKELYDYFHPEYANKPFPTDKSSDEFTITLGSPDRFATITCRGIDGTWTGAVDVSKDGYLYVDDLVRDREHSLSPQRMENTFQEYLNKMVDRKNDGARELMVGTLWNVLDPLQRISVQYELDERYVFRRIPALDENDESNFDYEINGFSTEYYKQMRERLANAEWMAKYQQQPYVREGLLFPQNECMFFDGIVEEGEWIVTAFCDPAFGGADKLSMPVKLKHVESGKQMIIDWVYKKGTQNITVPLIVDSIIRNVITELRIEKNAGGNLIADSIKKELEKRGCHHCKIIQFSASVRENKEERIKGYSDYVKDNFWFLMESRYLPTKEEDAISGIQRFRRTEMYTDAMNELHMHTSEGKNPNDDAADSITNMAKFEERKVAKVEAIANPFRTGGYYGNF
jgi:hypothetical protein